MNGIDGAFLEYMDRIMDIALGKKEGTLAEQRLAEKFRQTVKVGLERELFSVMEEGIERNIKQQKSTRPGMMRTIMFFFASALLKFYFLLTQT